LITLFSLKNSLYFEEFCFLPFNTARETAVRSVVLVSIFRVNRLTYRIFSIYCF